MTTNTPSSVSDEERAEAAQAVDRDDAIRIYAREAVLRVMYDHNGWPAPHMAGDELLGLAEHTARKAVEAYLARAATMTDTRVAEAVAKERAEPSPIDDEVTRAFIDGWNARLDHRDFDMALHFWMLAGVTHVGGVAIRNEGKSAPPVDQMKGEG